MNSNAWRIETTIVGGLVRDLRLFKTSVLDRKHGVVATYLEHVSWCLMINVAAFLRFVATE